MFKIILKIFSFILFSINIGNAQNNIGIVTEIGVANTFNKEIDSQLNPAYLVGLKYEHQLFNRLSFEWQSKFGWSTIDLGEAEHWEDFDVEIYCYDRYKYKFLENQLNLKYTVLQYNFHKISILGGGSLVGLFKHQLFRKEIIPSKNINEDFFIEDVENKSLHFFFNIGLEYVYFLTKKCQLSWGFSYKITDLNMTDSYHQPLKKGEWMLSSFITMSYLLESKR